MNLRQTLEQRIGRLSARAGVTVERCRIADPVSADDIDVVVGLTGAVAAPLLALYRQMNGVEIGWTMREDGKPEIVGSLDVLPMRQALLGISIKPDGEPFEGVLWNNEYPEAALKRLKKMRVLESTAGEPSFIAFVPSAKPLRLFHVYEETIARIWTDFDQTLSLLIQYLGCQELREVLTHKDWKERIRTSDVFARVEKL